MLAVVVRLVEALSAARERLELLRGVLRSLLNGWSEASTTSGRNDDFGCSRGCLRWGMRSVAPQARWRLPADSWMLGECFWKANWVYGGLERKIAVGWIFGTEGVASVCSVRFGL